MEEHDDEMGIPEEAMAPEAEMEASAPEMADEMPDEMADEECAPDEECGPEGEMPLPPEGMAEMGAPILPPGAGHGEGVTQPGDEQVAMTPPETAHVEAAPVSAGPDMTDSAEAGVPTGEEMQVSESIPTPDAQGFVPMGQALSGHVESGAIPPDEAEYLQGLSGALEDDLNGQPLAKQASHTDPRVANTLAMVKEAVSLEEVGRYAAIASGMGVALPLAVKGFQALAGPTIRNYRFKQMMGLPQGSEFKAVSPQVGAQYFVPGAQEANEGIETDAEQLEALKTQTLRKAFQIVDRYAPEITRDPEVARSFLNANINQGPMNLAANAAAFTRNPLANVKSREDVLKGQAGMFTNAINGVMSAYQAGMGPDEEAPVDAADAAVAKAREDKRVQEALVNAGLAEGASSPWTPDSADAAVSAARERQRVEQALSAQGFGPEDPVESQAQQRLQRDLAMRRHNDLRQQNGMSPLKNVP